MNFYDLVKVTETSKRREATVSFSVNECNVKSLSIEKGYLSSYKCNEER